MPSTSRSPMRYPLRHGATCWSLRASALLSQRRRPRALPTAPLVVSVAGVRLPHPDHCQLGQPPQTWAPGFLGGRPSRERPAGRAKVAAGRRSQLVGVRAARTESRPAPGMPHKSVAPFPPGSLPAPSVPAYQVSPAAAPARPGPRRCRPRPAVESGR